MTRSALLLVATIAATLPASAQRWMRGSTRNSRNHETVRRAFRDVVKGVRPSIVRVRSGGRSVALGVVVDARGFVLTKASELGDEVACELGDGSRFDARLVGVHEETDLAMLSIDVQGLTAVTWTERAAIRQGDWLVTPDLGDVPAAIGVLSVEEHRRSSRALRRRADLGVQFRESRRRGRRTGGGGGTTRISRVQNGGPAAKGGIAVGDVVVRIDDEQITSSRSMLRALSRLRPGQEVVVFVRRDGEELAFPVELGRDRTGPRSAQEAFWGPMSHVRAGFPRVIQHDTILRPNQCGGPLVDLEGRVVGINIARSGRVESLALPSALVVPLLDDLKSGDLVPAAKPRGDPNLRALGTLETATRKALALAEDALVRAERATRDAVADWKRALATGTEAEQTSTRRELAVREAAELAAQQLVDEAMARFKRARARRMAAERR